jgi:hypothetical protein
MDSVEPHYQNGRFPIIASEPEFSGYRTITPLPPISWPEEIMHCMGGLTVLKERGSLVVRDPQGSVLK